MAVDQGVVLLAVVGLVVLVLLVWTGRKRFPLRIGMGNFFRRKTQVAIVVAGLLIGTAIISSSYVIQSTFDYTIRSTVFHQLDYIDETITASNATASRIPFNITAFQGLHENLTRGQMPAVAKLAPRYVVGAASEDVESQLIEPSGTLIGFNATFDLGTFVRPDGSAWNGSGLRRGDVIVNQAYANDTEAKVGDHLRIFPANALL